MQHHLLAAMSVVNLFCEYSILFAVMKSKQIISVLTFLGVMVMLLVNSSCQENRRDRIEREAKEYTSKSCPAVQYQDPVLTITLDSLVFHADDPQNNYTYFYSFDGDAEAQANLNAKRDELYQTMLERVRNSVDLRHIKEEGFNIVYAYYKAGTDEKIIEFVFTPEDYR